MRLTRLDPHSAAPEVWRFMRNNLPRSMKTESLEGYGKHYEVTVGDAMVAKVDDVLFPWIVKLINGCDDIVTVFHPNYLSDIEDVVRKFESRTGRRVWIRYWADLG